MADIFLLAVIAVTAYLVAAEGAWGAATTFIASIISGLLATSYFETLADSLAASVDGSFVWQMRWDIIAFLGLFAASITIFRLVAEKLQPTELQIDGKAHDIACWGCGLGTGYVVGCLMAVALHLAPAPRTYLGFVPEQPRLFGLARLDMQWLGYAHRMSEGPLATTQNGVPVVFDGNVYKTTRSQPAQWFPDFPMRYALRREQFASGSQPLPGGARPAGPTGPPRGRARSQQSF